jgi:hypothetical protein
MSEPIPKRRVFELTPSSCLAILLVAEAAIWLSNRIGFPAWHKGYAVLAAIAVMCTVLFALIAWYAAALIFRRRFQFGIRSLLALVIAVALPFSWLAAEMKSARQQSEAVEAVEKLADDKALQELTVAYDYERDTAWLYRKSTTLPGSTWLREALGDDFFREVEFVDLGTVRTKVQDTDLTALRDFPHLRVLFIGGKGVTDAALENLDGLGRLEMLGIIDAKISDSGIARLAQLRLPSLQLLALDSTPVTDAVIEPLAQLHGLTALSLSGTQIDDRWLRRLKALPRLETLDLHNSSVTDGGLPWLAELRGLKRLSLENTKVTAEGAAKLRQALPDCDIER